jgi:hypothetical protein
MTKFSLLILPMASLAILLIAQSPPPPTPTIQAQNQQEFSASKQNDGADNPRPPITPAAPHKAAKETDNENGQRSTNSRIDFLAWVVAAAAVAQFIAMMVQSYYMRRGLKLTRNAAISAKYSARSAKKAVELAQQNFTLEHRAWIGPDRVVAEAIILGHRYTPEVMLKNSGQTYAKHVRVACNWNQFEKTVDDEYTFDFEDIDKALLNPRGGDALLPPNAEYRVIIKAFDGGMVEHDIIGPIASEQVRLFVYGKVSYIDIFDCAHWTKFCFRLQPGGNRSVFVPYRRHNEMDENC